MHLSARQVSSKEIFLRNILTSSAIFSLPVSYKNVVAVVTNAIYSKQYNFHLTSLPRHFFLPTTSPTVHRLIQLQISR